MAQIEEVAAALSVFQKRVGQLECSDTTAMTINNYFMKEEKFNLEYGVQRLHDCYHCCINSFFCRINSYNT